MNQLKGKILFYCSCFSHDEKCESLSEYTIRAFFSLVVLLFHLVLNGLHYSSLQIHSLFARISFCQRVTILTVPIRVRKEIASCFCCTRWFCLVNYFAPQIFTCCDVAFPLVTYHIWSFIASVSTPSPKCVTLTEGSLPLYPILKIIILEQSFPNQCYLMQNNSVKNNWLLKCITSKMFKILQGPIYPVVILKILKPDKIFLKKMTKSC